MKRILLGPAKEKKVNTAETAAKLTAVVPLASFFPKRAQLRVVVFGESEDTQPCTTYFAVSMCTHMSSLRLKKRTLQRRDRVEAAEALKVTRTKLQCRW